MYCSVLIQGKLVGLEGKAPGFFSSNLSIFEIFQNTFRKKKLEIINENDKKQLAGCDDA